MITSVLFDLDETLYNEMEYVRSGYLEVANYLCVSLGMDKLKIYDRLIALFEDDRKKVLDRLCSEMNLDVSDTLIKIYKCHQPKLSLKSDVIETLNDLGKSYKLGVLTDGSSETQWNKYKSLGLQNYIISYVCTGDWGSEFAKPHSFGFMESARKLDCTFEEMIYVGDNPNKDFFISTEINLFTVQLLSSGLYRKDAYRGGVEPNYKIISILDLPVLIENINRLS
jgi:putative hydrolase of the HAD superfamily